MDWLKSLTGHIRSPGRSLPTPGSDSLSTPARFQIPPTFFPHVHSDPSLNISFHFPINSLINCLPEEGVCAAVSLFLAPLLVLLPLLLFHPFKLVNKCRAKSILGRNSYLSVTNYLSSITNSFPGPFFWELLPTSHSWLVVTRAWSSLRLKTCHFKGKASIWLLCFWSEFEQNSAHAARRRSHCCLCFSARFQCTSCPHNAGS